MILLLQCVTFICKYSQSDRGIAKEKIYCIFIFVADFISSLHFSIFYCTGIKNFHWVDIFLWIPSPLHAHAWLLYSFHIPFSEWHGRFFELIQQEWRDKNKFCMYIKLALAKFAQNICSLAFSKQKIDNIIFTMVFIRE